MYCPQCLTEYRDGFFECADCHVPLAPGLPPEPPPKPDAARAVSPVTPDDAGLELVTVLETDDAFAISLAKAALEDAGIEYMVYGETSRYAPIGDLAGRLGSGSPSAKAYCVQVTSEFQKEARELLEPFEEPLSPAEMEAIPEPDDPARE